MPAVSPVAPQASRAQLETLRSELTRAAFTLDGVTELIGEVASAALHREQGLPALLAARSPASAGPTATLLRLFLLGDEVRRAELDAALPATTTFGAEHMGLVRVAGHADADLVRAAVDLQPYSAEDAAGPAQWWVASDPGELATGGALHADHVLGIGGASTTLAQLTVRSPVGRTLDLGTGCGVQALHAARHSGAVVATDISRRALGFAAFNAALAGVELDLRAGSMLDPVAGESFDLVVSNPPFVITPRAAYAAGLPVMEYRDGGRSGDDLIRDLVIGVGGVLAPGGVAQLLGNWEHRDGLDWADRVGDWLDEAGLDGWVIQREVQDPAEYAELWLRDGGLRPERDRAAFDGAYAAWLADFRDRGVTGVGFGYLTLRRPAASGDGPDAVPASSTRWHRVEQVTGPVRQPLGGHLAAVLAAQEWLTPRDAHALAAERFVVAPDVTEERYLTPGASDPQVILLRQGGGLSRTVQADTALAALVGACDGELTLGQITVVLAGLLEVDATALAAELEPQVRALVLDGMLAPA